MKNEANFLHHAPVDTPERVSICKVYLTYHMLHECSCFTMKGLETTLVTSLLLGRAASKAKASDPRAKAKVARGKTNRVHNTREGISNLVDGKELFV